MGGARTSSPSESPGIAAASICRLHTHPSLARHHQNMRSSLHVWDRLKVCRTARLKGSMGRANAPQNSGIASGSDLRRGVLPELRLPARGMNEPETPWPVGMRPAAACPTQRARHTRVPTLFIVAWMKKLVNFPEELQIEDAACHSHAGAKDSKTKLCCLKWAKTHPRFEANRVAFRD